MQRPRLLPAISIALFASLIQAPGQAVTGRMDYQRAADYSARSRGLSLLIMKGGKVVFEEYHNGHAAQTPHMLASGTKSFSGVVAVAAVEDGLLKLDEKVSNTITEWKADSRKEKITIRQLLSLTSGIDTGDNGRPPAYAEAVKYPMKHEPGTTFEYGPVPFQVFGEVMRRKLASKKETPLDYLKRRILNPIGLSVASWTHQNGQPNLPSGAFLTTREWARFGQFIYQWGSWDGKQIVSKKLLEECFAGTKANPNYGLTFWLNRSSDGSANVAEKPNGRSQRIQDLLGIEPETTRMSEGGLGAKLPKDVVMAAGAGKQRLYVIPSLDLIVVRQGRQSRFDDREFLSSLLLER
jgi:CubicO group peptidase (beta-lactamase class C family)